MFNKMEIAQVGMTYINHHPRAYGNIALCISSILEGNEVIHRFEYTADEYFFTSYSYVCKYLEPMDGL